MKSKLKRVAICDMIRDDRIDEKGEAEVLRYGAVTPPLVCREGRKYRLLRGDGTVSALEAKGFEKLRCMVVDGLSEKDKRALRLSSLLPDLSPSDGGELIADFIKENGITEHDAAEALFVPESFIKSRLAVYERSPAMKVKKAEAEKERNIKMAFKDYRIFKNTIDKTVERIRLYGVKAVTEANEKEGGLEYVIRLGKEK